MSLITETLLQLVLVASLVLILKKIFTKNIAIPSMPSFEQDDVADVYESLNDAIHKNKDSLRVDISHMDSDEFVSMYHGFEENYPALKLDLKSETTKKGKTVEYILFDLKSYNGPRNKDLTIKLSERHRRQSRRGPQIQVAQPSLGQRPFDHSVFEEPLFFKPNLRPFGKPKKTEPVVESKVFYLDDYRNKKRG